MLEIESLTSSILDILTPPDHLNLFCLLQKELKKSTNMGKTGRATIKMAEQCPKNNRLVSTRKKNTPKMV